MKIIFLKLLLSFFLGGLIGIERGFKGKAAGFRTMILICYGSTLLTIISVELVKAGSHFLGDPSRIAANIITGIGLLGAGIIMKLRGGEIHGLTTAATLWVTASIGITIGAGYYIVAVVSTFFIVIILTLLKSFESKIGMIEKKYKLTLKSTFPLETATILNKFKIKEDSIMSFSHGKIDITYYWEFLFSEKDFDRDSLINRAYSLEGVKEFKLEELDV